MAVREIVSGVTGVEVIMRTGVATIIAIGSGAGGIATSISDSPG